MTFRIFTNDRGKERGVPMFSCLRAVKAATPEAALSKITMQAFDGPPDHPPYKAIEWPARSQASKDWLAKHVG